jgi:hypothetical protein
VQRHATPFCVAPECTHESHGRRCKTNTKYVTLQVGKLYDGDYHVPLTKKAHETVHEAAVKFAAEYPRDSDAIAERLTNTPFTQVGLITRSLLFLITFLCCVVRGLQPRC